MTSVGRTPGEVECFRFRCQGSSAVSLSHSYRLVRKAVIEAALGGSTRILTLAEMIPLAIQIGVKITHQKTSNKITATDIDSFIKKKERTLKSFFFFPE